MTIKLNRIIQCDVTMHFDGQPSKTLHVWRAADIDHAKRLALLDCQAKGWNIKKTARTNRLGST